MNRKLSIQCSIATGSRLMVTIHIHLMFYSLECMNRLICRESVFIQDPFYFKACPSPALSTSTTNDDGALEEAEAIMLSEAIGSKLPVIKNDLKHKIIKRRRESGLNDIVLEEKKPQPEQVCFQMFI